MKIEATFMWKRKSQHFSFAVALMQTMMQRVLDDRMDLFEIKHQRIKEPISCYHGEVQYKVPQPAFTYSYKAMETLEECHIVPVFRVNNKNSRTTSMMSIWCLYR